MDAVSAIIWKLLNTTAVTNIVGNNIEKGKLLQGEGKPGITCHRIDDPPLHLMAADTSEGHPRVQVDCLSPTITGASDLADAVIVALKDTSGTFGGEGDQLEVQRIFKKNRRDGPWDSTNKIATENLDFEVWHD